MQLYLILQAFTNVYTHIYINPVPFALYQLNFTKHTTDRRTNRELTAMCTEAKRNNKVLPCQTCFLRT